GGGGGESALVTRNEASGQQALRLAGGIWRLLGRGAASARPGALHRTAGRAPSRVVIRRRIPPHPRSPRGRVRRALCVGLTSGRRPFRARGGGGAEVTQGVALGSR